MFRLAQQIAARRYVSYGQWAPCVSYEDTPVGNVRTGYFRFAAMYAIIGWELLELAGAEFKLTF